MRAATAPKKRPLNFDRSNSSLFGRWWWTVDRVLLFLLMLLIFAGMILVTAASPPVATRLGYAPFHFVYFQQGYLLVAIICMIGVSLLEPRQIRRIAILGTLGAIVLMALLPFIGTETKGAIRWIRLGPLSLQPSEFLKPCFAVFCGWILSEGQKNPEFAAYRTSLALFLICALLLLKQPDVGMTITLAAIFGVEWFLAGIPVFFVAGLMIFSAGGMFAAYRFMPHVHARIDAFLDPSADNYQVAKSLEAFQSGGWLGRGPGEGIVKWHIPDSHTDFIFAVAAEEFGILLSIGLVMLFAVIVMRSFWRVWNAGDSFILLGVSGLVTQFAVQAIVNMSVTLKLIPAKGMTLPFLSYGGSALISMGIAMGMLLGLTRQRFGTLKNPLLHGPN